jgi:hypothetical protein
MRNDKNTQQLKAELAKMARNGSPEELQFRSEIARCSNKTAPSALGKDDLAAEKRWKKAQSGNYTILIFIVLLSVAGYPLQIIAELLGGFIGVNSIFIFIMALGAGVYAFVKHNQKHRKAYIDFQVSRGMSEIDAFRDYENKFSGS